MGSDEYLLIFDWCYDACCISLRFGCGGYGYGGLFSGLYGGFGPFLGYGGGLFGGLPYFGFGGYGGKEGYGYGGKGGYGYGGSRYKRSTDSYTTAQPSPVTHYSRTVHVSGHFSPAVVYSYPMHDGDRYGNTHSSYGYTSTPSYAYTIPSYGHSYGHNTPSYGYATPPSQGHSPSYSYTSY